MLHSKVPLIIAPVRYYETLGASNNITTVGGIDWYLFGTLIVAWVVCFLCMSRGILFISLLLVEIKISILLCNEYDNVLALK